MTTEQARAIVASGANITVHLNVDDLRLVVREMVSSIGKERLLTLEEAAAHTGKSKGVLYHRIRTGVLKPANFTGKPSRMLFRPSDLANI